MSLYEEQQNKSRSCPTCEVDQNLSFGLSISGASERVRIASKFSTMPWSKIYSGKDLGQFKKCELVAFLKAMIPELSLVISCILYLFFATEMTWETFPALGVLDSSPALCGFINGIGRLQQGSRINGNIT